MKFVKYGFYLLTLICCGVAVWMQVSVSGDNLLTMDTGMGYMLAVSYRWVTLAAVILVVLSLMIFAISRLRRKKTEGKKPGKKERAAAKPAAPVPAPAAKPAAPAPAPAAKPAAPVPAPAAKSAAPAPAPAAKPAAPAPAPAAKPAASVPAPAAKPAAPAGGFCIYCGSRVAAGKRFCPNCGRPIEP